MLLLSVVFLGVIFDYVDCKAPVDSIVVFAKSEGGYYCHKIPYLMRTNKGTLIALAEGRGRDGRESCDDFAVILLQNYLTFLSLSIIIGN